MAEKQSSGVNFNYLIGNITFCKIQFFNVSSVV